MLCMPLIKLQQLPIKGDKDGYRFKNRKNTRSYIQQEQ